MRRGCILISFLIFVMLLRAQQDTLQKADSIASRKQIYKGPRTASILSAIIPGAGQVYNRKYWKVPIIYAGLGGLGYLFVTHQSDYSFFRRNLAAIHDNNSSTENETPYNSSQLVTLKNDSRRLRDLSAFGMGLIYLLNIVDANVDAHLKTFDVSDDLSLELSPVFIPAANYGLAAGFKLNFIIRQ